MKRLGPAMVVVAIAAAACEKPQQQTQAADTTQMSDTAKMMMSDTAHMMAGDTPKTPGAHARGTPPGHLLSYAPPPFTNHRTVRSMAARASNAAFQPSSRAARSAA